MTTERLDPVPAPDIPAQPRRLRRRERDRVIAGVAGGLADYLNVDPILIRAVFAGLMVFGASGLAFYLIAWLLIPSAGRDQSIIEDLLAQVGLRFGRTAMALLIFLIVVAVGASLTGPDSDVRFRDVALFATAIVVIGIILLRWGEGSQGSRAADATGSTSSNVEQRPMAPPGAMAQPEGAPPVAAQPSREQSPLAWYTVAAALVAAGLLAVIGNLPGLRVTLSQYLGAILVVFGLGLVVSIWWGRARILMLLGTLLLPIALASAFITVPLGGGLGDLAFRPQTAGELRSEYRLAAGGLQLDLTGLAQTDGAVPITASIGVGRLVVIVPADARLQLEAKVNGGRLSLLGNRQTGTWLTDHVERPGGGGLLLILRLETGLGSVAVESAQTR